ncbi:MAG: 3'(2'),5'-bisphosphate nucleotidase CysQ [Erysipelotrichaceae bacterium]
MKNNLKNIEEICSEAAILAGHKIMEIYNNDTLFANVEYKSDKSPLTLADTAANTIIVETLSKHFPSYAILSEEEQDDLTRLDNPYCFIVDPLDGTKEFIKRNGQFTVNIALAYNYRVIMGVIYVPYTQELYTASKNNGSYYIKGDAQKTKIQVSKTKDLSKVRLVMSSSHGCQEMDDLIEKYHFSNFVKMGSSLKGCLVAKGEAEIYYRHNPTMEWDTAAMQCIVEEAGGIFRQLDGSEMLYNRKNSLNHKGFYIVNCKENIL